MFDLFVLLCLVNFVFIKFNITNLRIVTLSNFQIFKLSTLYFSKKQQIPILQHLKVHTFVCLTNIMCRCCFSCFKENKQKCHMLLFYISFFQQKHKQTNFEFPDIKYSKISNVQLSKNNIPIRPAELDRRGAKGKGKDQRNKKGKGKGL